MPLPSVMDQMSLFLEDIKFGKRFKRILNDQLFSPLALLP